MSFACKLRDAILSLLALAVWAVICFTLLQGLEAIFAGPFSWNAVMAVVIIVFVIIAVTGLLIMVMNHIGRPIEAA